MTLRRYLSAIWKALLLTLRGQTISAPPLPYPEIQAWFKTTLDQLENINAAADAAGLRREQREAYRLLVDKREMTLEMALNTLRYHAAVEYPYLLKNFSKYSLMTLQATNLNDQYLAQRLAEHADLPADLRTLLTRLSEHLQALPQVNPH